MTYDLRLAERIRHLLADRGDVHERKMMGGLVFMVKGGMCCAASGRGGLLARVGPDASKLVKEIALFGGDITHFVSAAVRDDVVARVEVQGRLGDY